MFSRFYPEVRICGKRCHASSWKDRKLLNFNRRLRMSVSIKLLSPIFKILKILNFWKIINKKNPFKKKENLSIYQKIGICVKEHCQVYMCTEFHEYILKNDRVLAFWKTKTACFLFLRFTIFQNLSELGRSKSVLGSFFVFLTKKMTQKDVSYCPNPKFSVWPSLDVVTLNDLDLEYAEWKLRMILRSVPDTIHVVVLTYFHSIRL